MHDHVHVLSDDFLGKPWLCKIIFLLFFECPQAVLPIHYLPLGYGIATPMMAAGIAAAPAAYGDHHMGHGVHHMGHAITACT